MANVIPSDVKTSVDQLTASVEARLALTGTVYASTADGLAATVAGAFFAVPATAGYLDLWRHDTDALGASVATLIKTYPDKATLDAAVAATDADATATAADRVATGQDRTAAANSASAAATSETNAGNSATKSQAWAESSTEPGGLGTKSAKTHAAEAGTSASNAATSANNAATSATNASNSASAAATSETNAGTSATNAGNSATKSQAWAESSTEPGGLGTKSAKTHATEAGTSASNAATSATNAGNSASAAATSETNAGNSATSASGSATTAQAWAESSTAPGAAGTKSAKTHATEAGTSASNAATSATNASNSASAAATSETNAANSASAAAASFDSFDDRYLGAKSSAPTADNDGAALAQGALYWNTTDQKLYIRTGSGTWIATSFDPSNVAITGGTVRGISDLTVAGDAALTAAGTETRQLQIGHGRTGDGHAHLDLVGDATYPDYGTRLIRHLGAAGTTEVQHRGTGALRLRASEAAPVEFWNGNTRRAWISSDGAAYGFVPAGVVVYHAASSPPPGYLKCNGAAISRTTYSALFSAIGTTWGGGDGSTTFNLPDLRGEFVRGWDDARGADSGRAFASWQNHAFQNHKHEMNHHQNWSDFGVGNHTTKKYNNTTDHTGIAVALSNWAFNGNMDGETRPRNRALLACIKF